MGARSVAPVEDAVVREGAELLDAIREQLGDVELADERRGLDEVLAGLGCGAEEIAALRSRGVVA